MNVLADENLSEPIIEYLRSRGHDVTSGRSPESSGSSDDTVYRKAVEEQRVIVTMDKDFLRLRRFPTEACGGIIVVKVYRRTLDETLRIFREEFERLDEDRIRGNLVIITPEGARIRRPRS